MSKEIHHVVYNEQWIQNALAIATPAELIAMEAQNFSQLISIRYGFLIHHKKNDSKSFSIDVGLI